ncbi:hypothetical protein [Bartonella henselae]|nr:hypothetical protein [Bartonella henselae]
MKDIMEGIGYHQCLIERASWHHSPSLSAQNVADSSCIKAVHEKRFYAFL